MLTENKKEEIKLEFEKLKDIIDCVMEISGATSDSNVESRRFVVNAGIAIYNKI